MKPQASLTIALSIAALALIGCATQVPTEEKTAATVNARCEQTGSNLPRRECRSEVEVLKPNQIESLKGKDRPAMLGN